MNILIYNSRRVFHGIIDFPDLPLLQLGKRRTGAVDWEPRAGQKAAVDETVKLKVLQCDLDAPAEESIRKKQQH